MPSFSKSTERGNDNRGRTVAILCAGLTHKKNLLKKKMILKVVRAQGLRVKRGKKRKREKQKNMDLPCLYSPFLQEIIKIGKKSNEYVAYTSECHLEEKKSFVCPFPFSLIPLTPHPPQKKKYSGAHSRVATLIQPSFQKKTKNEIPNTKFNGENPPYSIM